MKSFHRSAIAKSTMPTVARKRFIILGFFLILTPSYVDSGTFHQKYSIFLSKTKFLSEVRATAEVGAKLIDELKAKFLKVELISQIKVDLIAKFEFLTAELLKVDAFITSTKQPSEIVELVKASQVVKKKPRSKNGYQEKPKRIAATIKFVKVHEQRKVSALFSKKYFKLIDEPVNIVNLRAGLRLLEMPHEIGREVENLLLAGIELCGFQSKVCGPIKVAEHTDLFFNFQNKKLTLSIKFLESY